MIKNWTVKTKQIKKKSSGFVNYINYLKDDKRPSHHHTKITILNDASKQIIGAVDELIQYKIDNKIRGRREPNNYATSFVISLPNDIKQPTVEQWQKIGLHAVNELADAVGVDRKKLKALSHIVLHDESSSPDKHTHLNIAVSNVVDCEVVKAISQYVGTHTVKNATNHSVERLLGVKNTEYVPKRENVSDKPLWASRAEKAQEAEKRLAKAKRSLTVIKSLYEKFKDDVSSWSKLFFTNNPDLKPVTASKAVEVENTINEIDGLSSEIADDLDNHIDDVEIKNTEPLSDTKVSDKRPNNRKKRRRKR